MPETLDDLLDKCEAMIDCGAGTYAELAKAIGKPVQSVYDWIGQRRFRPNGDTALKMQEWASGISTAISKESRQHQAAYRSAYKRVRGERVPGNGRD